MKLDIVVRAKEVSLSIVKILSKEVPPLCISESLSPEGNCESSTREGPLDSLSILLYVIDEPKLGLQKYHIPSKFLKDPKTFIVEVNFVSVVYVAFCP